MNRREKKRLLWDILVIILAMVALGYIYVTRILSQQTIDGALALITPSTLQSDLMDPALVERLQGRLTAKDIIHHDTAAYRALTHASNAERTTWKNPQSGHSGAIIPIRIYQNDDRLYCREYIQSVTIGDNTYDAINTACRQPDNTWKMVENSNGSV